MHMLWVNFILGLNFISFCFKLIIIHYHTPKQREIKFKPRIKLNHNTYMQNTNCIPFVYLRKITPQTEIKNIYFVKLAFK